VLDTQGRILTPERSGCAGTGPGIVRTDPTTGNQTMIASGPLFTYPTALAFDKANNLVVGNGNQLVCVDMQTGHSTSLATITGIMGIQDIEVDQRGQIVVLDFGFYNSGGGKVVRFNPATGQQVTVSSGGYLFNPCDLVIRPSGDYIVSNGLTYGMSTQMLEIDPDSGAQRIETTVSGSGFIALQDHDNILYGASSSVDRISLLTGQRQAIGNIIPSGGLTGITIWVPHETPEPSTITLLLIGAASLLAYAWRRRRV
jgi:sugar lactone lactonase YvrE